MSIEVICDGCNKTYCVKEELAGRRIKCKECGEAILIAKKTDTEKSILGEVFSNGTIALKMVGGALATPVLLVVVMAKAGKAIDFTDPMMIAAVIGAIPIGALLGALLAMKDVVQGRVQRGTPVPFPLVLMLGKGLVSALLWIPLGIFVAFVITLATL